MDSILNKSIKYIETPLNKTFKFLFMGLIISMTSTTYAEEKKENGGHGELTSNIGNACFKTESKSVSEVCANYRIRWKMWSLMGEPVGNYSLDWKLKSITLTGESKDYSSANPSWNFTPATLPAELKESVMLSSYILMELQWLILQGLTGIRPQQGIIVLIQV